jgi:uncharacterized protein YndB with AHSA1/START domain
MTIASTLRVELQAEVAGRRADLFPLVATAAGLRTWLDGAELHPVPDGEVRLALRDAVATGRVVALEPPQHVSFTWDWEDEPLGVPSVVAFDLIDHGARTHLTLRHVGFPDPDQAALHDALWRHWFARLVSAARRTAGGRPDGARRPAQR